MGGGNSSPVETDPEPPQTDPDEDDLGYVDGVKLIMNTSKIKVRSVSFLYILCYAQFAPGFLTIGP